jgi:hypothetical protein
MIRGPHLLTNKFDHFVFKIRRFIHIHFIIIIFANLWQKCGPVLSSALSVSPTVADLEEGPAPFFAQNLPSNVSKTQDLRPKIDEVFAISGGCTPPPPFLDPHPFFRNFWIRHWDLH